MQHLGCCSKTWKITKKETPVSQTFEVKTISFDPDADPSVSENTCVDNDPENYTVGSAAPNSIPISGSSAKSGVLGSLNHVLGLKVAGTLLVIGRCPSSPYCVHCRPSQVYIAKFVVYHLK